MAGEMSTQQSGFAPLLVRQEGPALIVTVDRPDSLNALNASVLRSLGGVLDWVEAQFENPSASQPQGPIRAMILTGTGEKAFVAGADIKEFETMTPANASEFARSGQKLFTRLERLKIPVIAAVNGFALGGGLELALACDFIIASDNAKFGLPECTLGIMPGFGGTVRLPRRIGAAKARELTFTGQMISAPEALNLGLVAQVVPQAELLAAAQEFAKTVSQRAAPLAVGMIKRSIHEGMNLNETQADELEARLFGELFGSEDKNEGVSAFIGKRKAVFKGK
jgi:enoyl-CoA hydratase